MTRRVRRADEPIVFSYEPRRDGDADPGEVVWGWVAYEDDPTQGKDRPILVVGRQGADVVGVALSTKDRGGHPDRMPVGTGAWDDTWRPSYACLDRLLRFPPTELRREGAALERHRYLRVVTELSHRYARPRSHLGRRRARGPIPPPPARPPDPESRI
jgi:hypothetical protein